MSFRILLIIILVSFGCSSKDSTSKRPSPVISDEVSTIVEKLAKGIVEGNAVGESGALAQQHLTFLKLLETASDEELTSLTDAENSTVRCYTIWGLYSRQTVNLETIMREHQSDSDSVQMMFGCIGFKVTVGEFLADLVDDKKSPTRSELGR